MVMSEAAHWAVFDSGRVVWVVVGQVVPGMLAVVVLVVAKQVAEVDTADMTVAPLFEIHEDMQAEMALFPSRLFSLK